MKKNIAYQIYKGNIQKLSSYDSENPAVSCFTACPYGNTDKEPSDGSD